MSERLQKVLARGGIASRRAAEEMIAAGRVRVNGRVVTEPGTKAERNDKVEVDGKRVVAESVVYLVLNKPRGVVATMSDPEGRPTVAELLNGVEGRVFPVGRLDFATSGVLLCTNDGAFADGLLHPKMAVPKTYIVKVAGRMEPTDLEAWEQGIELDDGKTLPAEAKFIRHEEGDKTWFELTIREGRNQQIRRMGAATGFPVMRLARLEFAGVGGAGLKPGAFRHLSSDELAQLKKTYGVPRSTRATGPTAPQMAHQERRGPRMAKGRPDAPARGGERAPAWGRILTAPAEVEVRAPERSERSERAERTPVREKRAYSGTNDGPRPRTEGGKRAPFKGDARASRGPGKPADAARPSYDRKAPARPVSRDNRPVYRDPDEVPPPEARAPRGEKRAPYKGASDAPRGEKRAPYKGASDAPRGEKRAPYKGASDAPRGEKRAPYKGASDAPRGEKRAPYKGASDAPRGEKRAPYKGASDAPRGEKRAPYKGASDAPRGEKRAPYKGASDAPRGEKRAPYKGASDAPRGEKRAPYKGASDAPRGPRPSADRAGAAEKPRFGGKKPAYKGGPRGR
jgi:23S rRNA pseudouridine2605 synthase